MNSKQDKRRKKSLSAEKKQVSGPHLDITQMLELPENVK